MEFSFFIFLPTWSQTTFECFPLFARLHFIDRGRADACYWLFELLAKNSMILFVCLFIFNITSYAIHRETRGRRSDRTFQTAGGLRTLPWKEMPHLTWQLRSSKNKIDLSLKIELTPLSPPLTPPHPLLSSNPTAFLSLAHRFMHPSRYIFYKRARVANWLSNSISSWSKPAVNVRRVPWAMEPLSPARWEWTPVLPKPFVSSQALTLTQIISPCWPPSMQRLRLPDPIRRQFALQSLLLPTRMHRLSIRTNLATLLLSSPVQLLPLPSPALGRQRW